MDADLGISVLPHAAVSISKRDIKLSPQKIKNVKIWRKSPKGAEYIDEDVIFLGYAEPFIGHFLADSLSRAWPVLEEKYANYTFAIVSDGPLSSRLPMDKSATKASAAELFSLLGIKKLLVVQRPTAFRNLLVPDSSFNYMKKIYNRKYSDTFAKIAQAVESDETLPKKIYLSRTKLIHNPVIGESRIEKIFQDNGYTIIHPQEFPIVEQIAMIKNATDIAGIEGTALHLSLFARDGINLICIHRYNVPIPMQILIDKLKNFNAQYVDASIDPFSKEKNICPACIIGINENLRRFFNDNNFKHKDDAAAGDAEMKTFLEIYAQNHRILPKWLINLMLAFVTSRERRQKLRKKFAIKF